MKNKLTLGSLFDGSGGFPLGGLLSGITPVWASEIEPFPIMDLLGKCPRCILLKQRGGFQSRPRSDPRHRL